MAMVQRKTPGERLFDVVNYTLVAIISIVCLYPMLYVLFCSFSDPIQLMQNTGFLWKPLGFSTAGYEVVIKNPNIPIGYRNTLFYLVVGTTINMLMTTLGAYALSRNGYRLKKFFTFAIVFTMYFSGGMIPNFLLVKNLHILDTPWALLLPGAIGTWNLIVMRTSFNGIPRALEESAKIDGANDFIILFKIFIPVAKAAMAVILLFYAVGRWNSWFEAMIYLRDRNLWPLQLFLREILILNSSAGNTSGADLFYIFGT